MAAEPTQSWSTIAAMNQPQAQAQTQTTQCWSTIVKTQPPTPPQNHHIPTAAATNRVLMESCKSTKGISFAVVDANAIIQGGDKLTHCADKFVTVSEVINEIRDPVSRSKLELLPFTLQTMEPSPESLKKVVDFARATGDLQTLSDVDMKLIALAYTLEAQIHGTKHLRECPPPVHVVNVKRLPEKDMPGWGSNVPNLDEWEALEQEADDGANSNSKILPLKDINLNIVPEDGVSETGSEAQAAEQDGNHHSFTKPRKYLPVKKPINIEGKMVVDGVDASKGQYDDNANDWLPAVSRNTHRRYLRRKSRQGMSEAASEKDTEENSECNDEVSEEREIVQGKDTDGDGDMPALLQEMSLEEQESPCTGQEDVDANLVSEEEDDEIDKEGSNVEISSQTGESVDTSNIDDSGSEQSWMLRSLSESSVACITGDFAMQNVLLQMGLRLLAPGGMQIRQLHRWVLKCHACYEVTTEIGRIFCPKCGNGGTLRKVAVTVGENGITLSAHRPRINLRGTRFSLPLPKSGRDAITKNPILREDQVPHKVLYPKTRKKVFKEGDNIFCSDDMFSHHSDKNAPRKPPVGRAIAVFMGKRNVNDNHYSRARG